MVKKSNKQQVSRSISGGDSNDAMMVKVTHTDYQMSLEMTEKEFNNNYLSVLADNLIRCMDEHYRLCNNQYSTEAANGITVSGFIGSAWRSPVHLGLSEYNHRITNTLGGSLSIECLLWSLSEEYGKTSIYDFCRMPEVVREGLQKAAANLMAKTNKTK